MASLWANPSNKKVINIVAWNIPCASLAMYLRCDMRKHMLVSSLFLFGLCLKLCAFCRAGPIVDQHQVKLHLLIYTEFFRSGKTQRTAKKLILCKNDYGYKVHQERDRATETGREWATKWFVQIKRMDCFIFSLLFLAVGWYKRRADCCRKFFARTKKNQETTNN